LEDSAALFVLSLPGAARLRGADCLDRILHGTNERSCSTVPALSSSARSGLTPVDLRLRVFPSTVDGPVSLSDVIPQVSGKYIQMKGRALWACLSLPCSSSAPRESTPPNTFVLPRDLAVSGSKWGLCCVRRPGWRIMGVRMRSGFVGFELLPVNETGGSWRWWEANMSNSEVTVQRLDGDMIIKGPVYSICTVDSINRDQLTLSPTLLPTSA
jgi:hypothetical protein